MNTNQITEEQTEKYLLANGWERHTPQWANIVGYERNAFIKDLDGYGCCIVTLSASFKEKNYLIEFFDEQITEVFALIANHEGVEQSQILTAIKQF